MTDIVALGRPHPRESPLQLAQERAVYFPGAKSRQKGRGSRFGRCRCVFLKMNDLHFLGGVPPSTNRSHALPIPSFSLPHQPPRPLPAHILSFFICCLQSRLNSSFVSSSSSYWLRPTIMGKINLTALRVRQTALNQFASGKTSKLPQWVGVVGEIPPAETLIRTRPPQHELVQQRLKTVPGSSKPQVVFQVQEKRRKPKKPSRLFQPVELKYEEDQLRTQFFRDHPWELARPRVLQIGRAHV